MNAASSCAQCGQEGLSTAIEGLCPRCLAALAFGAEDASTANAPRDDAGRAEREKVVFGDYELLEEIARGGSGVVYKAMQRSLRRVVAVKMLLLGHRANDQFVRRFRAEAEAAAVLQHPNIVRIYECSEEAGQHFYSMEYVAGQNLAERARDNPLPPAVAADYVRTIAGAVHHAHERGILHRDLKPSNILIDSMDQPRVTDFGLARRLHQDPELTLTGQVLGTLNYMSPEQARGRREEVTIASDIYSMGAILYHLLTGRPPFHAGSMEITLHRLLNDSPTAPHRYEPSVSRELEIICLKCLEKEPKRRYSTAQDLADDLGRWRRNEPIHAHPASAGTRFRAWCRRKPALATSLALAVVLMLVLVVGSLITSWRIDQARQAEHAERERALTANRQLLETVTRLELQRAEDYFDSGDASHALAFLARGLRENPTDTVLAQRILSALMQRSFTLPARPPIAHGTPVVRLEFSPDGQHLLSLSTDEFVRVWDTQTGQLTFDPLAHAGRVWTAQFDPSGSRIASGSADHTARVWDARSGAALGPPLDHPQEIRHLVFSPDGLRLATADTGHLVRVWDARVGLLLAEFRAPMGPVRVLQFSHDGAWILSAAVDNTLCLWNSHTGQLVQGPLTLPAKLVEARFEPGDRRALLVLQDRAVCFEPLNTTPLQEKTELWQDCDWASIGPDGRRVVTISREGRARLWDLDQGRSATGTLAHESDVSFAGFSPDGLKLVTVSVDNSARLWETSTGRPLSQPMRQPERLVAADFTPDSQQLAIGGYAGVIQFWDVRPRLEPVPTLRHGHAVRDAKFGPGDSHMIVTAGNDHTAKIWDSRTGHLFASFPHEAAVRKLHFSPGAQTLVTVSDDGLARLWDLRSGQLIGAPLQHGAGLIDARYSPDGARVVTFGGHARAMLWNALTGTRASLELDHMSPTMDASFSPDGARIFVACRDGSVSAWDSQSGVLLFSWPAHHEPIQCVAFNPDGSRLVTASDDNTARIWDAVTGAAVTVPLRHARTVAFAAFSPDGKTVATSSLDNTARLWQAETGEPIGEPIQHAERVWSIRFSPDGHCVLTASRDHTARVWDSRLGLPLSERLQHKGYVNTAQWSPDGQRVLTASVDGTARVWEMPRPEGPIPDWWPELAETIAGLRFNRQQALELVTWPEFATMRAKCSGAEAGSTGSPGGRNDSMQFSSDAVASPGHWSYERIARHLLASSPTQPASNAPNRASPIPGSSPD